MQYPETLVYENPLLIKLYTEIDHWPPVEKDEGFNTNFATKLTCVAMQQYDSASTSTSRLCLDPFCAYTNITPEIAGVDPLPNDATLVNVAMPYPISMGYRMCYDLHTPDGKINYRAHPGQESIGTYLDGLARGARDLPNDPTTAGVPLISFAIDVPDVINALLVGVLLPIMSIPDSNLSFLRTCARGIVHERLNHYYYDGFTERAVNLEEAPVYLRMQQDWYNHASVLLNELANYIPAQQLLEVAKDALRIYKLSDIPKAAVIKNKIDANCLPNAAYSLLMFLGVLPTQALVKGICNFIIQDKVLSPILKLVLKYYGTQLRNVIMNKSKAARPFIIPWWYEEGMITLRLETKLESRKRVFDCVTDSNNYAAFDDETIAQHMLNCNQEGRCVAYVEHRYPRGNEWSCRSSL